MHLPYIYIHAAANPQMILGAGSLPVVLQLLKDGGLPAPATQAAAAAGARATAGAGAVVDQIPYAGEVTTLQQLWEQTIRGVHGASPGSGNSSSIGIAECRTGSREDSSSSSSSRSTSDMVEGRWFDQSSNDAGTEADSEDSTDDVTDDVTDDGLHSSICTSGPFKAPPVSGPISAAVAASASTPADDPAADAGNSAQGSIGPALVLEQAVGLACMLSHNPDNHFLLVNEGLVPLLMPLLQQGAYGVRRVPCVCSCISTVNHQHCEPPANLQVDRGVYHVCAGWLHVNAHFARLWL